VIITDSQIHLWPTEGTAPPHHWRTPYTIERALADMDAAGIDRVINCPAIWDPAAGDYADEAALAHPTRFGTMGRFVLDDGADESRVDEWMAKPGMVGLRFLLNRPATDAALADGALDWLWDAAHQRGLPVALAALPEQLSIDAALRRIGDIARRFPGMRLLIDHLYLGPFDRLPEAAARFDALIDLARIPNVAVKASAVPAMATDPYPFASTHSLLRRVFDAYGAERMFWGSDFTRLQCSWEECVSLFTEELPWLKGRDLELVMGEAISNWIGWDDAP